MNSPLWLFIYFPRLALESWFSHQTNSPQLLLNPATKTVMQCNELAEQAGVEVGMKASTASCLLSRAQFAHYDEKTEQENLERLAILSYRFSAQISIQESGLLLEIGSMLKLFKGLKNYWQQLHNTLLESGFSFICCTAHTSSAAQVLAKNKISLCTRNPLFVRQALDQLGVQQLGLTPKHAERLRSMGLTHYCQLRQAPSSELGYRFGKTLMQHLKGFESNQQQTHTSFSLPPRFSQSIHLMHEVEHANGLIFPVSRILQAFEHYLQGRQLLADSLKIRLEHREHTPTELHIQAIQGLKKQKDWQRLLAIQLEQTRLVSPVIAIKVKGLRFKEDKQPVADLLGYQYPKEDSSRLLAFLVARLGHQNVQVPITNADPRPEKAGILVPAANTIKPDNLVNHAKQQPVFRLSKPKPATPEQYQIMGHPERIVSGWWDRQQLSRVDYFIARHKNSGCWHWLGRQDNGRWQLVGVFS